MGVLPTCSVADGKRGRSSGGSLVWAGTTGSAEEMQCVEVHQLRRAWQRHWWAEPGAALLEDAPAGAAAALATADVLDLVRDATESPTLALTRRFRFSAGATVGMDGGAIGPADARPCAWDAVASGTGTQMSASTTLGDTLAGNSRRAAV